MTPDPTADLPPRPWYIAAALVAAVVLGVFGAAFVGWSYWRQQPEVSQLHLTERGEQKDVELPDGTRLTLDASTRLEVLLYRTRRVVRVSTGQVLFDVPNDGRPFDVAAGPLRLATDGARFALRHTPRVDKDPRGHVAVRDGTVQVSLRGLDATVAAGEQLTSDADGRLGAVTPVAADAIAPWRLGRVTFTAAPLADVLAEFERYGPTGLVPADPAVGALPVTGTFDPRRPDALRQALPDLLPVMLVDRDRFTEVTARP